MRERWACMMRVRNEERWIRRSLERTFEVCKTVIILDDGSEDFTADEALNAVGECVVDEEDFPEYRSIDGQRVLHYIPSPFRPAVREHEAVNEIRDKNFLWAYAKCRVDFDHMLCLDGDEMLSKEAIRVWPHVIKRLEDNVDDIITIPFIYLWDGEDKRRVDGLYGDGPDGMAKLRFPRIFSIKRVPEGALFDMRFSWQGTKGGFHCGSIPREAFVTNEGVWKGGVVNAPVVHFGYIDDPLRQKKFVFYNTIDPNNAFEGEYRHIIGQPDQHAPGPVQLVEWRDE